MGHAAPIARLALAYGFGAGMGLAGAPLWTAPLLLLLALTMPIGASARPRGGSGPVLVGVVALGLVSASGAFAPWSCPPDVVGATVVVEGRFLASPRSGSGPFERADRCGEVTVVAPRGAAAEDGPGAGIGRAGRPVLITGVWREGRRRPWLQATRIDDRADAGIDDASPRVSEARWLVIAWRDGLVERIGRLYGDRAPVVSALVLARREGLEQDVREVFAVTGIAHLLAISGFHVGIVAGLVLTVLRVAGLTRRRAALASAGTAWAYVGLIGFPDAACRAALILTLVAASAARGRPSSRWGALSAAAVVLLLIDPTKLGSPGFQLSFAGAGGLVAWAGPMRRALDGRFGRRAPGALTSGVAAGAAATLATLPIVAWHFERVAVIGIPMTLAATPLVTLALPGALATIALDFVSTAAAEFLAGGVGLVLDLLIAMARTGASWTWASVWTSRTSVVAGLAGVALATLIARRPGIGARGRRALIATYLTSAVAAWPILLVLEGRGALEIVMIDVGQGDAVALRSPAGRWLLVDAGPPLDGDARAHPVVRALRARGVERLDALILTHADADHFGGAEAVLSSLSVARVLDPALPVPKRGYADLLATAARLEVPWSAARAGRTFDVDGVTVSVLHPSDSASAAALAAAGTMGVLEANDLSVVVLVSWRGFRALLTGDAYVDVERALAAEVGDIHLLKVGHHGSDTSTDPLFLASAQPELALVSVGARNRYGHPAPAVLERLRAVGARVHRTDLEGTVRVIVRGDGTVRVRGGHGS
jgi:competence protein ComEC